MTRASVAAVSLFGSMGGGAYAASDQFLYPFWMKKSPDGDLLEPSKSRREKFFLGKYTDPKTDWDKDFDHVVFPGEDRDRGWYIPHSDSEACLVAVHGAGNDRREWLKIVDGIQSETKSNMLLFDCRNHGKCSGNSGVSFGAREHEDVLQAIAYAKERGNKKIILMGTSQGAASALIAAAKRPDDIHGLILENSFASASEAIDYSLQKALGKVAAEGDDKYHTNGTRVASQNYLLSALLQLGTYLPPSYVEAIRNLTLYRAGVDETHIPELLIPAVKAPIYILHGTQDRVVPISHSHRLKSLASSAAVVHEWYPHAEHSMLYNAHPAEYMNRISSFIKSIQLTHSYKVLDTSKSSYSA